MHASELSFLNDSLNLGEVMVLFTKADGSERKMICTKQTNLIPQDKLPTESGKEVEDLIRVFDLEVSEWRSFKPSRVIEWSPVV